MHNALDSGPLDYSFHTAHGFLNRDALYYPCPFEQHRRYAITLFQHLHPGEPLPHNAKEFFVDEGWAMISSHRVTYYGGENDLPMSPAQIEAILAWHAESEAPTFEYNGGHLSVAEFLERLKPVDYSIPLITPPGFSENEELDWE